MAFVNYKLNHHRHNPFNRHNRRGNHLKTEYISIQSQFCKACGTCLKECPRGVIGRIHFIKHEHAHIDNADACIGCKKCVKACPNKAIIELPRNHHSQRKKPATQQNINKNDWANPVLDLLE